MILALSCRHFHLQTCSHCCGDQGSNPESRCPKQHGMKELLVKMSLHEIDVITKDK